MNVDLPLGVLTVYAGTWLIHMPIKDRYSLSDKVMN